MVHCQTMNDLLSCVGLQCGRQSRCRGPAAVFSERISAAMRSTYNLHSFLEKLYFCHIIFVISHLHADNLLSK